MMVARLKELRTKKGVSQQQLADVIGISQQSVNKYENHGIEPDIWTLMAIADYFAVSVDYLIGHSDIERMIEPIEKYDLNQDEAKLIDNWRRLNPSQRSSIHCIIENYLA